VLSLGTVSCRRIEVQIEGEAPIDIGPTNDVLARNFDDAYQLIEQLPGTAQALFMSLAGPQPAFSVRYERRGAGWLITVEVPSLERDYVAAATVAEELARRHSGRAADVTTGDQLWPPLVGGTQHAPIARVRLSWWVDIADSDKLAPGFLAAAHQYWPAALPRCFSDQEPFLCETPSNEHAFLALCTRQAQEGGSIYWSAAQPSLGGSMQWPDAKDPEPRVARLDVDVAAAALIAKDAPEALLGFFLELAQSVHARFALARDERPVTLRLGTSFVVSSAEERPRLELPYTTWDGVVRAQARWTWIRSDEPLQVSGGRRLARPLGLLAISDDGTASLEISSP
jgi:hypothetical protein